MPVDNLYFGKLDIFSRNETRIMPLNKRENGDYKNGFCGLPSLHLSCPRVSINIRL